MLGVSAYGPKNPKMRSQARRFLTWCDKNHVDPLLYIEDRLLAAKNFKKPFPMLGRMASAEALKQHREHGLARAQGARRSHDLPVEDTARSEKKLRPHQERFKSFYAEGKTDLCALYQQYTGGFNPMSAWCKRCPSQTSCIDFGSP